MLVAIGMPVLSGTSCTQKSAFMIICLNMLSRKEKAFDIPNDHLAKNRKELLVQLELLKQVFSDFQRGYKAKRARELEQRAQRQADKNPQTPASNARVKQP